MVGFALLGLGIGAITGSESDAIGEAATNYIGYGAVLKQVSDLELGNLCAATFDG